MGVAGHAPILQEGVSRINIQRHVQTNAPQSEAFSADVSPERARTLNINPDQSVHGTSGPLEVTYSNFFYNQSGMSPVSGLSVMWL
jgi:hypothetical protein